MSTVAKFYALSPYALYLFTLEEEKIRYFVNGLNSGIQLSALSMAVTGKSFQDVEFAKKVETIKK